MFRFSILYSLKISLLVSTTCFILSCTSTSEETSSVLAEWNQENPPAPGFDSTRSDSSAIVWADIVMHRMGGRKKWDDTRYLKWNFFGRRDLLWDKQTGNVRIESPMDSLTYLINVFEDTGRIQLKGKEIQDDDSLANLIKRGKSIWINDSYWLAMPFKLKDSGVTLKYLREDTTVKGEPAEVLQLTFSDVGITPNNKYEVYITKNDSLVKQWAFFQQATQDSASVIWPWDNYKNFEGLLLSTDRSDNGGPRNVSVPTQVPAELFSDFEASMDTL